MTKRYANIPASEIKGKRGGLDQTRQTGPQAMASPNVCPTCKVSFNLVPTLRVGTQPFVDRFHPLVASVDAERLTFRSDGHRRSEHEATIIPYTTSPFDNGCEH